MLEQSLLASFLGVYDFTDLGHDGVDVVFGIRSKEKNQSSFNRLKILLMSINQLLRLSGVKITFNV